MDEDLTRRIAALEDIESIRSLRNRYHRFVNEREANRFREIYVPSGSMKMAGSMHWVGIRQIEAGFSDLFSRVKLLKQFGHNHEIELKGDKASATSYLDARYSLDSTSLMVSGRYDETYVRTADGWKICDTEFSLIFAVPPEVGWAGECLNYFGGGKP